MTRNKLHWAKKHLTLLTRIKLHHESLASFLIIIVPPLVWATADLPLVKKIIWSFSSWLKTIKRNIAKPMSQSTLFGLHDYYLRRLGDCPTQVRKLNKISTNQAIVIE